MSPNTIELEKVQQSIDNQIAYICKLQRKMLQLEVLFIFLTGMFFIVLFAPAAAYKIWFMILHIVILVKSYFDIYKTRQNLAVERGVLTIIEDLKYSQYNTDFNPPYINY